MKRRQSIAQAVAVTAEVTGSHLSDGAVAAIVEELAGYQEPAVLEALRRAAREIRGPLTLAGILDRLDDGHLGPESAWALVATMTEQDTVVWTDEIAQAWGQIRHLQDAGDRVASRMGFLEAYRARLSQARADHTLPIWRASLGFEDRDSLPPEGRPEGSRRAGVLQAAVDADRLTLGQAKRLLPPQEWPLAWDPARQALPAGPPPALPPGDRPPLEAVRALVDAVLERHPEPREEPTP